MITIYIDNKPYQVKPGGNLLHACLSLGFDIPYFCWHPAMHSVGACRQCAVKEFKDEHDTRGRIVMSCMTPVKDGMRISIEDAEAKSFRKSIVELLMLNHPHDCPVCDEGGECHLQDMTVMTGHVYRRTRFKKRTYRNQYLGPLVHHEMNRCIQCYRCVRFYRDYAGGRDLDVFASHDHVYFGRHKDGVLDNEFSGNLAEICPTGVFTDKTFKRHYVRKWDLQTAPSICVHCAVGCNTIPGERYGSLRRIRSRYNGEVNRYFLCDRGRYGYGFVNSEERIRGPLIRADEQNPQLRPANKDTALERIRNIVSSGKTVIGIGSPRASLEANYALRTLVGPDRFHNGMSDRDSELISLIIDILKTGPARSPSLREAGSADAVLVLGEDVTNTAPVLALALRQASRQKAIEAAGGQHIPGWDDAAIRNAVQDGKGNIFIAAPYTTKLDEVAASVHHAAPDDCARLGFAIAHEMDDTLPAVAGIDQETRKRAASIAGALVNANQPLVVSGMGCGSAAVIEAAAQIAWALCRKDKHALLCYSVPECNNIGLGMMAGRKLGGAFSAVRQGQAEIAVILENDLYSRADRKEVDDFFSQLRHAIVVDHLLTPTAAKADIVLPAAAFSETDGTLVNLEGRAQRFYQVHVPGGEIQKSWHWLREIMTATGRSNLRDWQRVDDVLSDLSIALPDLSQAAESAPPAGFRIHGLRIPRQPHRYSGRTAMFANRTVFEPKPPKDPDSPLAFSMEGYPNQPPPSLVPRFWAPGWNSPQAMNKFQSEVGGPLKGGDPGKRLLEPAALRKPLSGKIPGPFAERKDSWLIIAVHHIFGSDPLSMRAPWIAELAPKPYLGLDLKTANLTLREGDAVSVRIGNRTFELTIKHLPGIPRGVAGVPAGLTPIHAGALPVFGTISSSGRQSEVRP